MRISPQEKKRILLSLKAYAADSQIYLHGSRIDDSKKGGDIDLFFVVKKSDFEKLKSQSYKLAAELSRNLNEQKVDLLILSLEDSSSNEFFLNSHKLRLD